MELKTYEITYALRIDSAVIVLDAHSEEEALKLFNNMTHDEIIRQSMIINAAITNHNVEEQ